MNRINDKINEINEYLYELAEIVPTSFEEYNSSNLTKAACERYVEKIVEAVTDLAFLIIKIKKFEIPEDDIDAFNILLENKLIDNGLAKKMKDAKRMKNIISHQYGKVNDEIVFEAINKELEKDIRKFVENVKRIVK
ncbi:DUF86 domain-containing protein [Candidatus Woesearchaeota archaeon]|nr:DUF86 domain-containing protein [Candidatus Woesearchaeota archaeon]